LAGCGGHDTFIGFIANLRRLILDQSANRRSIIALIVGLIVVAIIYFLIPTSRHVPHGVVLPTGKLMAPVAPDQVSFYNNTTLGVAYRKLGYINVQYHSVTPSPAEEQVLANYVRQLAAAVGGNGVVINLFGHTLPNEVPDAQASYVFRGEVVYSVPNS
jgi:hypothetical protein